MGNVSLLRTLLYFYSLNYLINLTVGDVHLKRLFAVSTLTILSPTAPDSRVIRTSTTTMRTYNGDFIGHVCVSLQTCFHAACGLQKYLRCIASYQPAVYPANSRAICPTEKGFPASGKLRKTGRQGAAVVWSEQLGRVNPMIWLPDTLRTHQSVRGSSVDMAPALAWFVA